MKPHDVQAILDTQPTPAILPAKSAKKRRAEAYVARLTVSIPLDMKDADTLAQAITAVAKIKDTLPPGSVVETISASFGKMP